METPMIICSCTVRTDDDFEKLYEKYAHRNLKAERLARLIWRDFSEDRAANEDRCGMCILHIVSRIKEKRAKPSDKAT